MNDRFFQGMSVEFKNSYIKWCNQNKKLKHGVGYANVEITTLYHGNKKIDDMLHVKIFYETTITILILT